MASSKKPPDCTHPAASRDSIIGVRCAEQRRIEPHEYQPNWTGDSRRYKRNRTPRRTPWVRSWTSGLAGQQSPNLFGADTESEASATLATRERHRVQSAAKEDPSRDDEGEWQDDNGQSKTLTMDIKFAGFRHIHVRQLRIGTVEDRRHGEEQ